MKYFLICIFLIFSINIQAHEMPQDSVLKAHFTQYRYLRDIPKPIKSEGQLVLWEGKGLLWSTHSPFPNSIIITKQGIYQLQNNTIAPMVKNGGNTVLFEVMVHLFKINQEGQVKGFTTEKLQPKNSEWRIRLIPQHDQVRYVIQSITVEGNTHITHISIARPYGDHDEIDVDHHEFSNEISAELKRLFL